MMRRAVLRNLTKAVPIQQTCYRNSFRLFGSFTNKDWERYTKPSGTGPVASVRDPSEPLNEAEYAPSEKNRIIANWLYGCCGIVGAIVVIGGITRLTESGLSIVDWKPIRGIIPPLTAAQWEEEFTRYQQFPEFKQKSGMTLSEFQFIFFWEWFHRVLARGVGIVYGGPLLYFTARGYFRGQRALMMKLYGLLLLGGGQGAAGWWMVKSGLDDRLLEERKKATVSGYRLSTHLTLALLIYAGMLRIAFGLTTPRAIMSIPPLRMTLWWVTGSMLATAITGACTAALDAGLLYCDTFPWMGEQLLPPAEDIFQVSPWPRNLFENGCAAQTFHRLLAANTVWGVFCLNVLLRRKKVKQFTPAMMGKAMHNVNIATGVQFALGIITVMSYVNIPIAVLHQANSVMLLGTLIRMCAIAGSKGIIL